MARAVPTLAATAAAGLFYSGVIERNWFTLRRFEVPVLEPGTPPIRLLHVSDLHITPPQRRKHAWIRGLAGLRPDLVINTGDTLSAPDGIPAVMRALDPLYDFPGAFVPGNNDYYVPTPKNPAKYFTKHTPRPKGPQLPWPEMARAMASAGWLDLTHRRERVTIREVPLALAGTDDPHLR
ncbi:MAG: metallophosphoesterase, partial [Jatrophihabitantaceae bacterium]